MGVIPRKIMDQVLGAFTNGTESLRWQGYFALPDEANQWCIDNFGITSDCNETVCEYHTFRFNWHTERWFVSAGCPAEYRPMLLRKQAE